MARKKIIETPEEFDMLVLGYLAKIEELQEPITLTGLILHLGLSSRQSLSEYAELEEFSDSVRMAKLYVEHGYEKLVARGGATNGAVFVLKNFGWSDKNIMEIQGGETPVGVVSMSRDEYLDARRKMLEEDDI